jgi:hypothetical protein
MGSFGRAESVIEAVPNATLVDARVMASAEARGDVVYVRRVGDFKRLRRHFPGVRCRGA